MKMVAVLPLYNTSSTNDSHSIMNVTGKRFERNPSKTIWSYAPSDCLLKQKSDRKWRNNHQQQPQGYTPSTATLASASLGNFSELLETYKLKQLSAVSFSHQASNDEHHHQPDSTMTSSVFFEPNYRHKDSKVLSIEKKKLHNSSSIINMEPKKTNEANKPFKDDDNNIHLTRSYYFELKDRKSAQRGAKQPLLAETSYQNFCTNPSVNVPMRSAKRSAKSISNRTAASGSDRLASGKQVVFGEHIDNLSNSLFSALSNGINKNLLATKSDMAAKFSASASYPNNNMALSSFVDDDYSDVNRLLDREDSLVIKICNEIKTCKETNKHFTSEEKSEKDELSEFLKKDKVKSVKIMEPEVSTNTYIAEYDDLEATPDFPSSYFDCKSLDDIDTTYKYQSAITKQHEQVLAQYDGNLPVEVALKQLLPEYTCSGVPSAKARRDSIDSKNSAYYDTKKLRKKGSSVDLAAASKEAEILNVLKRMMVKKKYEIATIRLEKASGTEKDKKKKRLTSAQNSAPPATTSTVLPSVKQAVRPKTSVITPAVVEIKPFTEDDDEEFEQLDNDDVFVEVNRCASCKKVMKPTSDKCISEDDLFYNDYQITKEAFEQYEWPFEMNYSSSFVNSKKESSIKKQASLSSRKSTANSNKRCYSCAKVFFTDFSSKSDFVASIEDKKVAKSTPNISKKSAEADDVKEKRDKEDGKKIDSKNEEEASHFKNPTFSSSRHSNAPDKLNEIIDAPPAVENKNNCAHNILMNSIELLKYQRKSTILPGKTFYSQRRQSISIRPPPLSKIKEDNVKEINTISFIYPIENLKSPREKTNSNGSSSGDVTKSKVAVESFKLDAFNPVNKAKPVRKITSLKNEPVSAFQIYKKTSKLISRRPKTAKN